MTRSSVFLFDRYRAKGEQLEREKRLTDEALRPLQMQLLDLNEQLKESAAKTSALKAKISKNDMNIQQVLQMAVQM